MKKNNKTLMMEQPFNNKQHLMQLKQKYKTDKMLLIKDNNNNKLKEKKLKRK